MDNQTPSPDQTPEVRYVPDHDTIATGMIGSWGGIYAFFFSSWYRYQDGVWRVMHHNDMRLVARDYLREVKKAFPTLSVTARLIDSILNLAQIDCYVPDIRINNGDNYVNLRNGLFNLTTYQLEIHRPDVYFTWQLDFNYDKSADAPTFNKFLRTSLVNSDDTPDLDMRMLVLEAIGYTLTSEVARKVAFFVVGPSDSGKSTLVNLIVSMMGDMASTVDLNQLGEDKYLLSPLAGKRLIACTEGEAGARLSDGIFKMMTGGTDRISAPVKFKDPISYVPSFKLWWATNNLPSVGDRSGAVYRRIRLIAFTKSFSKDQQDPNLMGMLMQERSGIFNLALVGLKLLRQRGDFTRPSVSISKLGEYQTVNDPEQLYLNDCLARGEKLWVKAKELRQSLNAWRKENGYPQKPWARTKSDIERLGVTTRRTAEGIIYIGITLNQEGREYL